MLCQRNLSAVTHPSKLIKIYKCFFLKQIYDPLYYRYILFAVFPVLSIHLAFWQNQNSGIMGFQGFAYTSGKIFQLSFCSERFLFLERWKNHEKPKAAYTFVKNDFFLFLETWYRDWIWKQRDRKKEITKYLPKNH